MRIMNKGGIRGRRYFYPDVITALLESGANAKMEDSRGRMAIDYAQDNENLVNTNIYRKLFGISF